MFYRCCNLQIFVPGGIDIRAFDVAFFKSLNIQNLLPQNHMVTKELCHLLLPKSVV